MLMQTELMQPELMQPELLEPELHPEPVPAGFMHTGPTDTRLTNTGLRETGPAEPDGVRAGGAVTGFLELVYADGELLDAEFQELIGRILPPTHAGVRVAAPTAGRGRGRQLCSAEHGSQPAERFRSRTPPPARERSPPEASASFSRNHAAPTGRQCLHPYAGAGTAATAAFPAAAA